MVRITLQIGIADNKLSSGCFIKVSKCQMTVLFLQLINFSMPFLSRVHKEGSITKHLSNWPELIKSSHLQDY